MKNPWHKRTGIRILAGFLLLIVAVGTWAAFQVYHALPGSHLLFNWQHNHDSHLEFYLDEWSYAPGQPLKVYASANPQMKVEVVRTQALKAGELPLGSLDLKLQETEWRPGVEGANWLISEEYEAPSEPGLYFLHLRGQQDTVGRAFVVRPRENDTLRPLFAYLLPVNTWMAYNYWGGQSIYTRNSTDLVSLDRPAEIADPHFQNTLTNYPLQYQHIGIDLITLKLMDSLGYRVDVLTDMDLHSGQINAGRYAGIVVGNHSEYWTRSMFGHLEQFLNGGGSLMVLSGNTAFWETELPEDSRQMKVVRTEDKSWIEAKPDYTGLLGVHTHLKSMHSYAPYTVLTDSGWWMKGIETGSDPLIGKQSLIYDNSDVYSGMSGIWKYLRGERKMGAASGLEVDVTNAETPENWVTIARGLNQDGINAGEVWPDESLNWDQGGGAELGFYTHPGGGIVFNAGSVSFPGAIPYDPNIRQLLANIFDRIASPPDSSLNLSP